MKTVTPFLWLHKDAQAAAKFYLSIFKNARITSSNPMSVSITLDGQELILFNGGPHYTLTPALSLYVDCKTQKEIDYYWKKLSQGGSPLRCGWLTDKFGVTWQVIPSGLTKWISTPGGMEAMMGMIKLDIKALEKAATADALPAVGKPAERALASVGITKLSDVPKHSRAELSALHGMGPKALKILQAALRKQKLALRAP
jgi:predicted 3-demethylubiquinone-9 3-methyltransferase (glyoxalase superfamily)